jgi:hypothetical protein
VGIVLSEEEAGATGGFSTDPGGNTVNITFASLFGDPIVLPAFTAAAVSPATLFFTFPDTRAVLGRALAGPVEISITSGARQTAHILPRHLVALPPSNDVARIVTGALEQRALATLDMRGSIWIPVQFAGFGTMEKQMSCPGQFIPMTAFAVTLDLPRSQGLSVRYPPFRTIHRVRLFLGDFVSNGTNYYGLDAANYLRVMRIPHRWAIAICGVNDAVDLVMRGRGRLSWARSRSMFAALMPSSQPLEIVLSNVSADPVVSARLQTLSYDAFGSGCTSP